MGKKRNTGCEFTVTAGALAERLKFAQRFVEKKTTVPILAMALFEVADSKVVVTTTDLESSFRATCPAVAQGEGAFAVLAKRLWMLLHLVPEDEELRFRLLENHWVQVEGDGKKYKLVGMARYDFPTLPSTPPARLELGAGVLAGLISRTQMAVSAEEARYTINAALLEVRKDTVAMVATDGHRLALAESPFSGELKKGEFACLIPKHALSELAKMVSEAPAETKVEFSQDDTHAFFQVGEQWLAARLAGGKFPKYEAALPRDNDKSVTVERDVLAAAMQRLMQLADPRGLVVFSMESGRLMLSASSPEYGQGEEEVQAATQGEAVKVGFCGGYVLDFLATAAPGPVKLQLKAHDTAGQFLAIADSAFRYRYVVMPMRGDHEPQ